MTRSIFKKEDKIIFSFYYDKEIIEDLKNDSTGNKFAKWNPEEKTWWVEDIPTNYKRIKEIASKYNFSIDLSLESVLGKKITPATFKETVNNFLSKYTFTETEKKQHSNLFKKPPREYQWLPVKFGLEQKRIINGDDCGCGKSLESIYTVEIGNLYPCLIVCPNSIKLNWKREIETSIKVKRSLFVVEDLKSEIPEVDFTIINYDKLGKKEGEELVINQELISKTFKSLIFDESFYCKHSKSIRTKSLKKLAKNIEYRIGLTGTMVTNRPIDVYSQVDIIGRTSDIGNWKTFVFRYCGAYMNRFGLDTSGATNIEELSLKLRTSFYLRREKREVLKDLPEKQITVLEFSINNKKAYEKAESEFIEWLKENVSKQKMDAALRAEILVQMRVLRSLAAKGKLEDTYEWIDNFLESGKKLVVFCMTNEVIDNISTKYKCDKINGSVSVNKRQEHLLKFIQDENSKILALNLMAGGVGLDGMQQVCQDMLVLELPDTPHLLEQAEARIDRSGQKESTNIYYPIVSETIEGKLFQSLQDKLIVANAINKGEFKQKDSSVFEDLLNEYLK